MPSLPRLRRTRPRGLGEGIAARPQPRIAEVEAAGLTWIHLDSVDPELVNELRRRFGWHALDVEDVLSKRQRPKVDDYADEGYLFGVLNFPAYDKNVQRLNAAELDFFLGPDYLVTIPNVDLLPVSRLFSRCVEDEEFRVGLFAKGTGRLLYEVLDDLYDYCFPILLVRRHRAGLEVLSRDSELARERPDGLHGRSPLARLDPRDVRVAHARAGQLPLGHRAIESQPAEPDRNGLWAAHSAPSSPRPS